MMYANIILISILFIGARAQKKDSAEDVYIKLFSNTTTDAPTGAICGSRMVCVHQRHCKNIDGSLPIIDLRSSFSDDNCPLLQKCCATGDIINDSNNIPDYAPDAGCGFRNENGVGMKIQNPTAYEAEFGEFPWMAAIMEKHQIKPDQGVMIYICGGSLISPTVVLTIAHCVYRKQAKNLMVRVGEWETNTKAEPLPYQNIEVKEMITHENYHSTYAYNDIAILFLRAPFVRAQHVNTVCLPPAGTNFDMSRCFATGWGSDQFQNGKQANILKKIDLPVIPYAKCQSDLRKTRLNESFRLHYSFICAGGERDKDTCKGDGGSPLVCPMPNNPNRFFQVGIVAWGIGCGEENVPGVYTSIPYLRSWIDYQLADKGIDVKYFTP